MMTAEDLALHAELVGLQVNEAFRLFYAGDIPAASDALCGVCTGCHESLAVAITLAEVVTTTFRERNPGAGPMGSTVVLFPGATVAGEDLSAAELMAAVVAAVGNGDRDGAHLLWHHEPPGVCVRAVAGLFVAAAALLRPVDGGGL